MRKLFTIFISVILAANVFAQSPEKMSYQAVIRNSSNQLVVNQKVGMQITILQGSATGTEVYSETQTPTTNANGLVSIEIGGGTGFSSIDWSTGNYFIKTETDPTGGNSYTITGASQLLSVPYALYAKSAGSSILGPQGPIGLTGAAGADGVDGARGLQGPIGLTGADGLTTSVNGVTQVGGAITLTKADIGLANVDNTADAEKPVSTLTQTALDSKASIITTVTLTGTQTLTNKTLSAPILTGTTTVANLTATGITTVATPVNATDAATKAYVDALETKLDILDLKVQLLSGKSLADLFAAGASVSDLLAAGASATDLIIAGAITEESELIGLDFQGGKIAYILQSGDFGYVADETHGLIAASSDQSAAIQWYNDSYTITGATAMAIGTGNANTNTIVASQGTGSYAAQLCSDLVLDGYDDWYLPSKDELNKLYLNRVAVGGFASTYYWSSTEASNLGAWLETFDIGVQNSSGKTATISVRAIRAF